MILWESVRPRAAQKPAGPRPNNIFDFGRLGSPERPRKTPAGLQPSDIFDLGAWAAPGGPGQPEPDQATASIAGVWAAPGGRKILYKMGGVRLPILLENSPAARALPDPKIRRPSACGGGLEPSAFKLRLGGSGRDTPPLFPRDVIYNTWAQCRR